jgi:hypothetical protein
VLGAITFAQNRSGTLVTVIVMSVLMLYIRPLLKKDMAIFPALPTVQTLNRSS